MKKWQQQTPTMSSAAIMKVNRQQLWEDLKSHPEWSVTQVDRVTKLISDLNKQIAKRSFDPAKVRELINQVKRHRRIYKRVGKTMKISKRAVKFVLKQTRKTNGKARTKSN